MPPEALRPRVRGSKAKAAVSQHLTGWQLTKPDLNSLACAVLSASELPHPVQAGELSKNRSRCPPGDRLCSSKVLRAHQMERLGVWAQGVLRSQTACAREQERGTRAQLRL
ncbi:unnamed protein product [Effrenium voratum]|nr:unnamed protein product [Effrenium voratum]